MQFLNQENMVIHFKMKDRPGSKKITIKNKNLKLQPRIKKTWKRVSSSSSDKVHNQIKKYRNDTVKWIWHVFVILLTICLAHQLIEVHKTYRVNFS